MDITKNRMLLTVFLLLFVSNAIGEMVYAVLILFALDLKATLIDVGLISLAQGIPTLILQLPLGTLSDKIGRKPMVILAEASWLISALVRSSATEPWHIIASALLLGVGGATFFPALLSLVEDVSEEGERTGAIATFYLFSSIGILVGPGVGSLLLLWLSTRSLNYIEAAFRIGLVAFVALAIKDVVRPIPPSVSFRGRRLGGDVIGLMKRRNMLVALNTGLFFFFISIVGTFTPVFARQELGLTDSLVSALNVFRGSGMVSLRVFLGRTMNKLTLKRLLILMLALSGGAGLLIPYSQAFLHLSILMLLIGACLGVIPPLGAMLVSRATSREERGLANSLYMLMASSGAITPIFMTPIAERLGLMYVFSLGAVLPFMAILPTITLKERLITEQELAKSLQTKVE